ncbi:unnamed protein product [Aureobasidium pullulans]|nr:unnamed protein product [Aureobasidium pullulans]
MSSSASLDLGAESQLSDKKALLLSLPEYKNARSISIFMSMPSAEINTESLTKDALSSGKHVFVPYIYKPKQPRQDNLPVSIMDMLQLASEDDYASLQPDKWGIPSIPKETVPSRTNSFGGKDLTDGDAPAPDTAGLDATAKATMTTFSHGIVRERQQMD